MNNTRERNKKEGGKSILVTKEILNFLCIHIRKVKYLMLRVLY